MDVRFTVTAIPLAQPRQRATIINGRAANYTPVKHPVNAFKASCRLAFSEAYGGPPVNDPVAVSVRFVLPRPQYLCWKTKPMPRQWHHKAPDLDNLQKSILDALSGLAWRNDALVCCIETQKWIASGDESPRVEVAVKTVEPVGVDQPVFQGSLFLEG